MIFYCLILDKISVYYYDFNLNKKKKKKEDGMIILENLVLHTQNMVMQHEKHKILHRTRCP